MIPIVTTILKELALWIIGKVFREKILEKGKDMLINPLYKYGAIAAVVTSILFSAYVWHKAEVSKAVEAATSALDKEYRVGIDEQRKRLIARSEASQRDMQAKLNQAQRSKQNEVKKLQSDFADLRSSLQSRPERSSDSGSNSSDSTAEAGSSKGATGMQLSRGDASFLAEFAGMAAELQTELKACIADYEAVRKELLDYTNK